MQPGATRFPSIRAAHTAADRGPPGRGIRGTRCCGSDKLLGRRPGELEDVEVDFSALLTTTMQALRRGLQASLDWSETQFGTRALTEEAQLTVSWAFAAGSRQIECIDTIPCLCSRLGEPGIKARVLQQFDQTREDLHDPVSLQILSRHTPSLRDQVVALDDDAPVLVGKLRRKVYW